MTFNKDKDEQLFLTRIVKLEAKEFIALAKLLEVKLSVVDSETKKPEIREAEMVINDCVNIFRKLPHRARKAVLKAMEK